MKAVMYWASGFGTFAGLLCLRWLPVPSGDQSAGALVLVGCLAMVAVARTAK
jgi:hypothetical protein